MLKKILCIVLVIMCLVGSFSGCSKKQEQYSGSFFDTFDTVITLYGFANDATEFNKYIALCHDTFLYYHQLFDIYNNYDGINNLKTINDNAGVAPVKVDRELEEFMEYVVIKYHDTNGKVNVAMGSELSIWYKYRNQGIEDPASAELPPTALLSAAANQMDIEDVIVDRNKCTVYLSQSGMSLDVGAVAKGYACQKVAEKLIDEGFENFVISAGGNVYAHGAPQDGSGVKWSVGVQNPDILSSASFVDTVFVSGKAVVTAGGYERYYTVNGQTYSHIIDPETLMPADNYLSVTVIADDSALADYMATELFLTDYERGRALCRKMGVDAIWVTYKGETMYTDGYTEYSLNYAK